MLLQVLDHEAVRHADRSPSWPRHGEHPDGEHSDNSAYEGNRQGTDPAMRDRIGVRQRGEDPTSAESFRVQDYRTWFASIVGDSVEARNEGGGLRAGGL